MFSHQKWETWGCSHHRKKIRSNQKLLNCPIPSHISIVHPIVAASCCSGKLWQPAFGWESSVWRPCTYWILSNQFLQPHGPRSSIFSDLFQGWYVYIYIHTHHIYYIYRYKCPPKRNKNTMKYKSVSYLLLLSLLMSYTHKLAHKWLFEWDTLINHWMWGILCWKK